MKKIKKFVLENLRRRIAILNTEMYQWLRLVQIEHFLPKVFRSVVMPKSAFEELLPRYKRDFSFEVKDDYWFSCPSGIILEPTMYIFKGSETLMNRDSAQLYYYTQAQACYYPQEKNFETKILEEETKSIISFAFDKYNVLNKNGASSDYTPELIVTTPTGNLIGLASSSTANSAGDCGVFEIASRYTSQNQLSIVLTGDSTLIRDCEYSKYLWVGFGGILEFFVASGFLNEYEADDLYRIVCNNGAYLPRDWFIYHSEYAHKRTWERLYTLIRAKKCH